MWTRHLLAINLVNYNFNKYQADEKGQCAFNELCSTFI